MADWQNWTDQFRSGKYGKTTTGVKGTGMPVIEVDPSDAYASSDGIRGMQLSFFHVPSQKAVYFKAFIVAYNETFNSDWASDTVYGRTDPIYMFKGTQRQISLNFKVPAFSEGEAYENLGRVQKLTQYLYPTYIDDEGGGRIIGQSPLVRMKVMNLAQLGPASGDPYGRSHALWAQNHHVIARTMSGSALFDQYKSTNIANQGILGVISSVQIDHNLEKEGVLEKGFNTVLPKLIDVSVTFNCIHEQTIGFDSSGNELAPGFPYNVVLEEPWDTGSESLSFDMKATLAEKAREMRDVRQQQLDDAEARYGGMFGTSGPFGIGRGRLGSDLSALKDGDLNAYEESALRGNYAEKEWSEIERRAGLGAIPADDGFAGWDK
ncbi:MAG TPA: hypothetical protein EYN67_20490 [Flavobacteriales bacterium]|nr:hypothetical protein [Flavobacteriales bacterium]HIO38754.1 hypothetical protein [Rhodospirillales bacterium]